MDSLKLTAPLMHVYFSDGKESYCGSKNTAKEIQKAQCLVKVDEHNILRLYKSQFHYQCTVVEIQGNLWISSPHVSRVCKDCFTLYILGNPERTC